MIANNLRTFIAGTSGVGKTFLLLWYIWRYIKYDRRTYYVYVTDNAIDYNNSNMPVVIRPRNLGFKHVVYSSEKAQKRWDWAKILQNHPRIYIETTDLSDKQMIELVNELSRGIWETRSALFAIDEAWQYLNDYNAVTRYAQVVRGGRKVGIDSVAASQRIVDIHPKILSLYNLRVIFRIDDLNDIMRASTLIQSPVKGKRPETVIPNLKQGEFIVRDNDFSKVEVWNTFDFPKMGLI